MRGYRKVGLSAVLGGGYLVSITFLCYHGLEKGSDPTALGVMAGGIAAGVGAVMGPFMWGNVRAKDSAADMQDPMGKPGGAAPPA